MPAAKKAVKGGINSYEPKKKPPLIPSSETVDAYKTYLLKSSHTLTAKDFAEGAAIPTDQVEKDILILENKIAQYKKWKFPHEEQEKQLEILKDYKSKVVGKHWPTAKQTIDAKSACSHQHLTHFKNATGEFMTRCATCNQVWKGAGPNNLLSKYYNKPFIDNLKATTKSILTVPPGTVNVPEEPTNVRLRVGKVEIDQRFIMQMGMLSNCNVSIAKTVGGGYLTDSYALRCSKCKEQLKLTDALLVAKENTLPSKIEEFCTTHKHDARARIKEGRHFREDG